MNRFALILLLLVALPAGAQTPKTNATVEWQHPTTYVDGTPLPAGSIKATRIVWTSKSGRPALNGSRDVPHPATTTVVAGLLCGDFDFTARTVLTTDIESDPAGPVAFATNVTCSNKPNPPTALGVQ